MSKLGQDDSVYILWYVVKWWKDIIIIDVTSGIFSIGHDQIGFDYQNRSEQNDTWNEGCGEKDIHYSLLTEPSILYRYSFKCVRDVH